MRLNAIEKILLTSVCLGNFAGLAFADEDTTKSILEQATALFRAGAFNRSVVLLEGAEKRDDPRILGLLVDVFLEQGRYDDAERSLKQLAQVDRQPSTSTRLARLAWLKGDPARAEDRLREALERQKSVSQEAPEIAPYHARLGRLLFDNGRLKDAEPEFRTAIKILNDQHMKAHELDAEHDHGELFTAEGTAGLALILAAKEDFKGAERNWKLVAARAPEPAMLALMGDTYASQGQMKEAESAYERAEKLASGRPLGRRELARFYADHGRALDKTLEWARAENVGREDIDSQDLLAWALYKNGQFSEAGKEIEKAMRLGTLDARLWYHAGMIHGRLGDSERSRRELEQALKINPHFHPLDAARARKALEAVRSKKAAGGSSR